MKRTATTADEGGRSEREKRRESDVRTRAHRSEAEDGNARASVTRLHREGGNQAVKRLHERDELQAKLEVSEPSGPAEREAKRVAARIVDGDGSESVDTTASSSGIGTSAVSSGLSRRIERTIRSLQGGGKPLEASTRSEFESRFGRDFSDVRVHMGPRADKAARSIDAEAFTLGTDVVFRDGAYDPDTRRGRRLIAHELAHVSQNRRSGASKSVRPTCSVGDSITVQRQQHRDRTRQTRESRGQQLAEQLYEIVLSTGPIGTTQSAVESFADENVAPLGGDAVVISISGVAGYGLGGGGGVEMMIINQVGIHPVIYFRVRYYFLACHVFLPLWRVRS
jgi:hypothetical protein